ncbi:hypothetical protein LX36DRAFT_686090 [Colletotrichum falcatum]|nr:hypothetical protein LX36DRAFT_686090 [Colletotrichum falcatum]
MSDPHNYTVGWICAIPTEFAAARAFLDEQHPDPESVAQNDNNTYALGTMGKHNVVIAVMPKKEYGIAAAATVARDMVHSFPNVRIGLMVGVGGGAPSQEHDIRLGDVVVGSRGAGNGGVIQYDYGKAMQNQAFMETGVLNQPPPVLLNAVAGLETDHMMEGSELNVKVERALGQWKRLRKTHSRPSAGTDQLYRSDFVHPADSSAACSQECSADISNVVSRDERSEDEDSPAIHYGLIASANQVMKNAETRDKLSREKGVLCFEMEAAGLMNHFPCLVVRGICDYSDSHKNKEWQGFAAMAAAAYAKDLLCRILPNKLEAERKIKEVLESMNESLACIGATTVEIKTRIDTLSSNSHVQKIRQWLSPPDTSTNYNRARETRHEGTGLWFLKSAAFQEWEHGSRKHLWLHGMPGSGKTVLVTTVLDHLAQIDDLVTLEFFFDFSDTNKQKPEDMCRSLAFQLYTKRIDSRKKLDDLLASHGDGGRQPTAQALSQCLRAMMQVGGRLCIVLDALDECIQRSDLLRWIQSVISSSKHPHAQLLATGRPEEEFMRDFRGWIGESCLQLDAESTNMDIQAHISSRLATSREFSKWKSTPRVLQRIREELDSLEPCLDLEELEAAMEALPSDLNSTYARILQNIPKSRRKKTIRLLQFLVHAEQPLTLQECVDVIAVRVDGGRPFDPADRLRDPTEITRFCPSLVVLTETWINFRGEQMVLHLAHFTVKEYLLHYDQGFRGIEPSISIADTCLFCLESRLFPLAEHAAKSLMDHARSAESSSDTASSIARFLGSERQLKMWGKWLPYPGASYFDPASALASGFSYACIMGFTATVRLLLSGRPNVNATNMWNVAPLQAASTGGYQEIVELLLNAGADVNAIGGKNRTALLAASEGGYQEIVRLLINAGANGANSDSNAVYAALSAGHEEIARMLLSKGAGIEAYGDDYGSALYTASEVGHPEVVWMLLTCKCPRLSPWGITVAQQETHCEYRSNLLRPCRQVSLECPVPPRRLSRIEWSPKRTKWLTPPPRPRRRKPATDPSISKQEGIDARDGEYNTRHGHVEICKSLLGTGSVDINSRDGFARTPLWWACSGGHEEVSQLLLEAGRQRGVSPDGGHVDAKIGGRQPRSYSIVCNTCTFQFSASPPDHYECFACSNKGFCICSDCFRDGGHCLVGSHRMMSTKYPPSAYLEESDSDGDGDVSVKRAYCLGHETRAHLPGLDVVNGHTEITVIPGLHNN